MQARTFGGVKMNGARLWLAALSLQALLYTTSGVGKPLRRSLASQQSLPLSKGGWRPVVGSGGLVFNFGTSPLHSPYKHSLPVLDSYPSSARPLVARDATKLTSIAQSYRPTTLRTIPAAPSIPAASQPISSYLNPFALPSNAQAHYKYVQNFPFESVVIRNPHNPYAARPVFGKPYPTKQQFQFKQQYPIQQLANIQPIQFPISTGKPMNVYSRPSDSKSSQSGNTEIYKTEVFKLDDGSQQGNQQVKTAQQQQQQQAIVTPKIPVSPYPQYQYQDAFFQPGLLGSFGGFGVPAIKTRDPIFPAKTTFYPPQTTKQTLFNSYSFAPLRTTPTYVSTTPKLQTTQKLQTTPNQVHFGSTWNEYKNPVTQAPKAVTPGKIDPNTNKGTFKPSPQDPFVTKFTDYKVSTYNPNSVQTTTFAYSNYHDYPTHPSQYQQQQQQQNFQQQQQNLQQQQQNLQQQQQNLQQQQQIKNYYNSNNQQELANNDYKKKMKIHAHDSVAAGVNQQSSQQYASPPSNANVEGTHNSVPYRATYEVTETYDEVTKSSPQSWPVTSELFNLKSTEEAVTKPEYEYYSRPTTLLPDIPEELAIVTEGDKGYDNSLGYDGQVESQSRRPLGDDFEPIGKHKLKDYYYKVSTPTYESHGGRRTKKPNESSKYSAHEVTTHLNSNNENNNADVLPTLPPNKHFKRPGASSPTPEPIDKDKIRKRTKIRRRRPPQGNGNGNRDRDASTRRYPSSTEPSFVSEESHTIRPRVRPTAAKPNLTTPTTSAVDLTTSAIPTISPTTPSIVKKKLVHRRPHSTTTTEKPETTTTHEANKESSIMKISASSRIPFPRVTPTPYNDKTSETPDYSHKQDEKDTPTSDIVVNADTLKTEPTKGFSFHRDAKPVEAKLEPIIREVFTTEGPKEESNEVTTTTTVETTSNTAKILRPRLKNKFGRPGFSIKDYRNRLSSTTSTEKPTENLAPKIRYPNRRQPSVSENKVENENGTERKKFTPKDPRHKFNGSDITEEAEKEIHSIRPHRQRQNAGETTETTTKISARIRNGNRRPRPTEEPETSTEVVVKKRPLRKKIKDSDNAESVQDVSVTDTTDQKDATSERTRSESAIMKIADNKKHHDQLEHIFEHSKRVSDLTLAASKDYNTPGMFKTVSSSSRRIPNYFTIATDDPILPIEAFFPQINQKKES